MPQPTHPAVPARPLVVVGDRRCSVLAQTTQEMKPVHGPRLGGSARRAFLRRHRDEALQERGRGGCEQADARLRARWHELFFYSSRNREP
jgi:hypothetical protein